MHAAVDTEQLRERHILECAARLPSPPDIVLTLVSAVDDDATGAEQIAELVGRDQALTVRVLKVANSSFFGASGRVGTVRDAVVILGFSGVCNLVIAAEIAKRYRALPGQRSDLSRFWRHGLLVAACASALARRCGAEAGFAFTGGLLHDIGKLVLASAYPEECRAAAPATRDAAGTRDQLEVERERYGADHAALGGWLAERWRFPAVLSAAMRAHHDPEPPEPLARLLGRADGVAHALAGGAPGIALQACADALVALGSRHTALETLAEIEAQAGAAADFFQGGG